MALGLLTRLPFGFKQGAVVSLSLHFPFGLFLRQTGFLFPALQLFFELAAQLFSGDHLLFGDFPRLALSLQARLPFGFEFGPVFSFDDGLAFGGFARQASFFLSAQQFLF